jgi:hypothetical protein
MPPVGFFLYGVLLRGNPLSLSLIPCLLLSLLTYIVCNRVLPESVKKKVITIGNVQDLDEFIEGSMVSLFACFCQLSYLC